MRTFTILCVMLTAALSLATQGLAVDITGTVKGPGGKGLYGVQVKATNAARKMAKSVFSDRNGQFTIPDLMMGNHTIRARLIGYEDATRADLVLTEMGATVDFSLRSTSDISDQLSSADYMNMLPKDKLGMAFRHGCNVCHQIGPRGTRYFREEPNIFGPGIGKGPIDTQQDWEAIIAKMRVFDIYGIIPPFKNEKLAAWLVKNKYGDPSNIPTKSLLPPLDDAAAKVIVTEYWMGGEITWLHDITTDANGVVWGGDYTLDQMYRLDPISGEVKNYKYPLPRTGAHTLNPDRDGNIWTTLQLADMIASFNPSTEQWSVYGGLSKGSLVHTFAVDDFNYIAYDEDGYLWATEFGLGNVVKLNPKTKAVEEYKLPVPKIPWWGGYNPGPYGIAFNTKGDGNIWYSQIGGNVIGKVDPKTGEAKQFTMPHKWSGPRRLKAAPDGRIWIPFYAQGQIGVFDPKTEKLKTYDLPHPGDLPYALLVDGATGIVWVCGTNSNTIYRFDPGTETFTTIPLPSMAAYSRMIVKDYTTGDIWTAYSNFPNAHGEFPVGVIVRAELPKELN